MNEKTESRDRGTVRVFVDQFKIRDFEAARAAVEGLTTAGFDVDMKPFTPCHERTGRVFPEHTYQNIRVYRIYRKEG